MQACTLIHAHVPIEALGGSWNGARPCIRPYDKQANLLATASGPIRFNVSTHGYSNRSESKAIGRRVVQLNAGALERWSIGALHNLVKTKLRSK